jgi:lysophospholipid acyltransferase (LPLAT)-like uncharacterized protein
VVVPHDPKWYQRLAAYVVFVAETILTTSLRFHWKDESGLFMDPPAGPVIFCVWHNRLALSMAIHRRYVKRRQPDRRMAALVSASKDGALLAAILQQFNVQPVRGSTSRRGPQALLELTSWAQRGYDLAITPDGPRGPRYVIQEGAIALAQLTGLPIVPVTCSIRRKFCVKSWDRFQIPWPLSRCDVCFLAPIRIPREASDVERGKARTELEALMRAVADD